jgi:hypothetical protein
MITTLIIIAKVNYTPIIIGALFGVLLSLSHYKNK